MPTISWNPKVKLILSDVDETVADLYVDATSEMITELKQLLQEKIVLFLITGQGYQGVYKRIVRKIPLKLRHNILISHCSGAEVCGFDHKGYSRKKAFYSLYNQMLSTDQKKRWRHIVRKIIQEFKLQTYPTMSVAEFRKCAGSNPLAIMMEDRGPQITFEVVNGYSYKGSDLRLPIKERASQLFTNYCLPLDANLGGVFALDFTIRGVSKTTAIKFVFRHPEILLSLGLNPRVLHDSQTIEIWGDKFGFGGTDRFMSIAVNKLVRSITFRRENPVEFPRGHNIIVWNGRCHLHEGLLEYLQSR